MESKHTKGPWQWGTINNLSINKRVVAVVGGDVKEGDSNKVDIIATIAICGRVDKVDISNAKLIAAAPKMKALLEDLYLYMFDNRLDVDLTNKIVDTLKEINE